MCPNDVYYLIPKTSNAWVNDNVRLQSAIKRNLYTEVLKTPNNQHLLNLYSDCKIKLKFEVNKTKLHYHQDIYKKCGKDAKKKLAFYKYHDRKETTRFSHKSKNK